MRKLSIKGLIVAAFALILAMALGATASLLVTDRMTREALARHDQAMHEAAGMHHPAAAVATYRELKDVIALSTRVTLAMRIATFLIGLVLAVMVYRHVAQMVATTADFAGRIERGDFAARFATEAGGETAALAGALNRMVDRLREAAEHEAAASRRLAFLVSATPAVIYATKAGGDYDVSYFSPNVRQQLGYTPEDFFNDSGFWANNIHPDDRERVLAQIESVFVTEHVTTEYRFRHHDGSWRWMHDETTLVRDAAGAPLELVGSRIDITQRKELEETLKRRDAILNAVAYGSTRFLRAGEESSEAQWQLAVEAVLAHLGEATGVSRIWIAQNSRASGADVTMRLVHRWMLPEFPVAKEDPLFKQDLSYQREGVGVEALRLRRGEVLQLRARDMPEMVRARLERLHIRSQLLAPIMLGSEWWGFMAFDDCVGERLWTETELEALRAAANLFGAAVAARTGRESLRASLETLGSVLEKLKRQSAEIERQNAELARASRMKSEFLAAITHELKTPLNAILGFADLLEAGIGGALAPEQKGHVDEILGAGKELLGLVNRLLELARLDAGKTPLAPAQTHLGALLREAAAAHAAAAQARGIAVAVEADEIEANVDARLLRRLLDELIDNAIKFNREGGTVTLKAGTSPSPQPRSAPHGRLDTADRLRGPEAVLPEFPARPIEGEGEILPSPLAPEGYFLRGAGEGQGERGSVVIEVADTGIGIPKEDQARLFQPFAQLDAALARQYAGTGLGLALVRRIAELHGGSIAVDSTPGEGSRFTVLLPRG